MCCKTAWPKSSFNLYIFCKDEKEIFWEIIMKKAAVLRQGHITTTILIYSSRPAYNDVHINVHYVWRLRICIKHKKQSCLCESPWNIFYEKGGGRGHISVQFRVFVFRVLGIVAKNKITQSCHGSTETPKFTEDKAWVQTSFLFFSLHQWCTLRMYHTPTVFAGDLKWSPAIVPTGKVLL